MPKFIEQYRKTGYSEEYIKDIRNAQKQRYYGKHRVEDHKRAWTTREEEMVLQHELPDSEICKRLHRSIAAVQHRRWLLKREES